MDVNAEEDDVIVSILDIINPAEEAYTIILRGPEHQEDAVVAIH